MENELFNEVENEKMDAVSGGASESSAANGNMTEITNTGADKPASKKGNYFDEKGFYHIVCTKCGKEINFWKPVPGVKHVVGPQVCLECNNKLKNKQKRR